MCEHMFNSTLRYFKSIQATPTLPVGVSQQGSLMVVDHEGAQTDPELICIYMTFSIHCMHHILDKLRGWYALWFFPGRQKN